MTTFVLHGGKTSQNSAKTNTFFRQFTTLINKPKLKYLMCYWARPKDQWPSLFKRDATKITRQSKKSVYFTLPQNPSDLLKQFPQHDGLYVAGGEAELIEPLYPHLSSLKTLLAGKVYLGSSMGAFMASTSYVLSFDSQDNSTAHSGLGLLPLNLLCHWNVEIEKSFKLSLLRQHQPSLPTLTLDEQSFITLYQ